MLDISSRSRPATDQDLRAYGSRALWLLLLAGGIVRIGLVFVFEGHTPQIVDAQDYDRLAVGLVEQGRYQDASGNLTSLRPPFYPLFVSLIYRGAGLENYTAVRVVQSILSLLTMIFVYDLGREIYSHKIGLWAAAGYCFYPTLLGMNNLILSEGLFTFFYVAAMLLAVRTVREPRLWKTIAMGVCLGLGALTRSVLWLFTPLFCVLLFFALREPVRKRLMMTGAALLSFVLVIFPWAWRNTQLHKTLTIVDVMGGRNVMMGNYEYTPLERSWATISDVTGDRAWHVVLREHTPGYSELTQGQIDKAAMKYGIQYFFSHPGVSIQRSIVKFFNFWQLERTLVAGMMQGIFGDIPRLGILGLATVICGSYAVVMFLALFGLWLCPPQRRWLHVLLVFSIVFMCLIHAAAFAHSRYHLPLMPILLVYAAAALANWNAVWERRSSWLFKAAAFCCLLLVAGWIREFVAVDLHHFQ